MLGVIFLIIEHLRFLTSDLLVVEYVGSVEAALAYYETVVFLEALVHRFQ